MDSAGLEESASSSDLNFTSCWSGCYGRAELTSTSGLNLHAVRWWCTLEVYVGVSQFQITLAGSDGGELGFEVRAVQAPSE